MRVSVNIPSGAKPCDKIDQCQQKPTSVDGRVVCNHGEKHGPVPNPELHDINGSTGEFTCANPDGTCEIKERIREMLRKMLQIKHEGDEPCEKLLSDDGENMVHDEENCAHIYEVTKEHDEAYQIAFDAARKNRRERLRRGKR